MSHGLAVYRSPLTHPDSAIGWTHVWSGVAEPDLQNCVGLTDEQAHALVSLGLIRYSGDYKCYRPMPGVELTTIKAVIA